MLVGRDEARVIEQVPGALMKNERGEKAGDEAESQEFAGRDRYVQSRVLRYLQRRKSRAPPLSVKVSVSPETVSVKS